VALVARALLLRVRAWVALGAFAGSLVLPAAAARHEAIDLDDPACGPVAAAGHASEQVEPVWPPISGDHCAVCHWLRAMGSAQPLRIDPLNRPLAPADPTPFEGGGGPSASAVLPQQSRAPPAFGLV
jgi:hypothetical protein